jgi:hypothetical protein|tara:strand:+ start:1300 stop:1629 length:330 start_codon:yes stop_codon:yes gene_type:complete
MAYIDPYEGTKKGVLAKFTFRRLYDEEIYPEWDVEREAKDVGNFYNDEYAVGFADYGNDGELDYEYNVERFDEETLEGNAWVWIVSNDDINALKSHESFIGSKLLKDIR